MTSNLPLPQPAVSELCLCTAASMWSRTAARADLWALHSMLAALRFAQRQSKLPVGNHATLQLGHIQTVCHVWDELGSQCWGVPPRDNAGPLAYSRLPQRGAALLSHIPSCTSASPPLPVRDGIQGNEREAAKVKGSPGPLERGRAGG